ncbi:MAG: hypothetical protein K2W95_05955 [Candidatus Obscuribacterales bacterium]|nr:hypothetical protein [Candidatus Obscuribacterales bacterium]
MSRDRTRPRGASSVELIFGLIMLIPVVLILLDLGFIMVSVFSNDSLCREACRAASATDPKDAEKIARQIVGQANTGGSTHNTFKLIDKPVLTTMKLPPEEQGGLVEGNVTLKTGVEVMPMFLVGAIYGGKPITFVAQKTFPYTFVLQPKPKLNSNKNNSSDSDDPGAEEE